ncbi:MAG: hypothetical protein ABF636_10380 [Acetobacter sp.]|uniref:hypothetical protein n=1 Tax=Acetobacter sp. TaxID=440 RepID=UPI0039EA05BD
MKEYEPGEASKLRRIDGENILDFNKSLSNQITNDTLSNRGPIVDQKLSKEQFLTLIAHAREDSANATFNTIIIYNELKSLYKNIAVLFVIVIFLLAYIAFRVS